MQAKIFHKPLFWVFSTILAAGLGYAAFRLFPITFPIVSLDLTMDRTAALTRASELATELSIGPKEYSQAVLFAGDDKAKIFIQLEGGGVEKFKEVVKEEYFAPYCWVVRHFNPLEKHEAMFYFMPDGRPYGFGERLPDSVELPNVDKTEAEALAKEFASKYWSIDFAQHTLVEHSTEEKPNGRIDHTLEYERTDATIGDAPYRVTIRISGNKPTKTMVDIKIPQAFERRYACMRSANAIIADWASTAMYILYYLLGCLLGLMLLLRADRDWLIWRAPFFWAFFISLGMILSTLNHYPLWWISYQTTDSTISFIASMLQLLLVSFGNYFIKLFIAFVAAESLTRKAFPNQIQLWSSAEPDVASSWQMIGRTIGGYLMISFDFMFVTLFYLFSLHYLGWWSPADTLIEPNILATYFPWFSPFISALRAGFWEECLFRAIPLASAMLLAKKYGKKYWIMGGAMILQAVIFAAAHANYPAQPAYARLVELIIPSFVFGGLYLAFGLIPAIISHVTYDLILMALPIFVSDAPGSFFNKVMVVLCGLIPIMVLLYGRIVKGRFHKLSEHWYNYLWEPRTRSSLIQDDTLHEEPLQPRAYRLPIILLGLLGFGAWAFYRHTAQDIKPLSLTRTEALANAQEAEIHFNLNIPHDMSISSDVGGKLDKSNIFVWRTAGKETYAQLDGKYIMAPHWKIRHASFDGDIVKSAEEYATYVGNDGFAEFQHLLPKEQEGASLTQEEARAKTHEILQKYYSVTPEDVTEISAREEKQPKRRDWEFIYRLKKGPDLGEGQLRIRINIGGDQVIGHDQLLHIPEEWERTYDYEAKLEQLIKNSSLILLLLLVLLLGTIIIKKRPVHPFALRAACIIGGLLLLKTLIQLVNLWPLLTADFNTSTPYWRQVGLMLTTVLSRSLGMCLFLVWLTGYVLGLLRGRCTKSRQETVAQGLSIGLLIAGIAAFLGFIIKPTKPLWLDTTNAATYLPWLSMGLVTFTNMISATLVSLFILHGLNMLSDYGRKNHLLLVITLLLIGCALAGFEPSTSLFIWLATGIGVGVGAVAIYYLVLRFNYCVVAVLVATHLTIDLVQEALLKVFPGAWLGAAFAIVICWLVAFGMIEALSRTKKA